MLKTLVEFLRKEGVSAFAVGDLTLSLAPRMEDYDPMPPEKPAPNAKRMADGLTPAQQVELYGQEMS